MGTVGPDCVEIMYRHRAICIFDNRQRIHALDPPGTFLPIYDAFCCVEKELDTLEDRILYITYVLIRHN